MLKETFIQECSRIFDIHPRDLVGDYRFRFASRARQALYLALHRRGWSYRRIGDFICRDPKTVSHGIGVAQYAAERDPVYASKVDRLVNLEVGETGR